MPRDTSAVLSIIDANNLLTSEAVRKFAHEGHLKDIASFVQGMSQAISRDAHSTVNVGQPSLDEVNFLPGSSLRGDSGCSNSDCRLPKIQALARYAALYSDRVIVPTKLTFRPKHASAAGEMMDRLNLESVVLGILELRSLIEAGIVALVPAGLVLCKEHWDEAVPEHRRIYRTAERMAHENASRFTVTYSPPEGPLGRAGFHFIGPEDYVDHGSIYTVLDSPPPWLLDKPILSPKRLSQTTVKRQRLLMHFFYKMANDAFLQTYFGSAFNARYLSDSSGEAEFFRLLNEKDELALHTARLCAHLAHSIPLFTDIPIKTVLKLRKDEPQAFQNYRTALTGIVKTYIGRGKSVGDAEAKEIYLDILKPEIDALETKAKNATRSRARAGVLKVVASSALVALGVYGGVLPSNFAEIVKTVGGFSVGKDLIETLGAIRDAPDEVRNHNLFFLLRLKQAKK